jgi:methyl-accepting chemotaxis protein
MWMDDPGALSSGNSRLLMFFVGMVAIAMVIQAIAVVAFAIGALKSQKRIAAIAEEIRSRAMPVIDSAESLFHDTAPKLRTMTDNLLETSHIVRTKAQEFDATLSDVNNRTRAQVSRVDDMVSTVLTRTASIAETIQDGIRGPLKQVAGVIAGFRVGLDVLMSKAKGFGGYRPPDL